jgi:hypothetical protein
MLWNKESYKFCDSKGYTYDMKLYLGKDRSYATDTMTAIHATVAGLMRRVENVGHKIYMDNFFSSPDLSNNLHSRKINCCGTVRLNQKGMPQEFRKTMKLTRGDIWNRVSGNLTAMTGKDKRHVNMLTNMHHPPAEGNFHDEHGNALKPAIIQDYNQHMGYADKCDCLTNAYSIGRWIWKWMKELFFHLLDLTVINSYIILHSNHSNLSHGDF